MSGLVEEIQRDATDPLMPIGHLLRKAKLVASKLGQRDTADWIDAELSGDFGTAEVPSYRRISVRAMHFHPVRGLCPFVTNNAIINETVNADAPIKNNATAIEQLAIGSNDRITIHMAPDIINELRKLSPDIFDIHHIASRSDFCGIIDSIRTRVLDWALTLENNGVFGSGMSFSPEEKERASSIVINMNGGFFAGVVGESHGVGAQNISHISNKIEASAKIVAKRLREETSELVESDRSMITVAAEKIETARDESALLKAFLLAKSVLVKVGAFVTKTAIEHEISSLLDQLPK